MLLIIINFYILSSFVLSAHLREEAKVLVDKVDQQDFEDIIAGKTVEPKGQTFKQLTMWAAIL